MASRDVIQLADTTHTDTGGGSNPSYAYDGNFSTAHSLTVSNPGGAIADIYSLHAFAAPHHITSVRYRIFVTSDSGTSDEQVYLKLESSIDNGANWVEIAGTYQSQTGGGTTEIDTGDKTVACDISGVTNIRAWAYARCAHPSGGDCNSYSYIYEVRAYEPITSTQAYIL